MPTGIQRVTYYQAVPVETCDRCNAGIKHVFSVTYKDGLRQRYGSECINKILATTPSLQTLFQKNVKLLQTRQRALDALNMPYADMPKGSEYYGSGLFFIADSTGKDIVGDGHWFFHPLYDTDKNESGGRYVVTDPAQHLAKTESEIARGKVWLTSEITRIESFLSRILAKFPEFNLVAH